MKTRWILAAMMLTSPADAQNGDRRALALTLPVEARAAGDVVDAFHAALGKGDTKAASALLAEDALIYESGRAERGKAEYAAHHLAADAVFARAVSRTVTRRAGRADGRNAWIASDSTMRGTYKSRTINSVTVETMVLRREAAGWRIVHIHWSSADVR